MTRRVYIGNSNGQFLFRASQPGVDAVTGDISRMALFDTQSPMVPKAQGTIVVPAYVSGGGFATASASVGVAFAYPPAIFLKATNGLVPGESSYWAIFDASGGSITFYSLYPGALTVKWFAFAEL